MTRSETFRRRRWLRFFAISALGAAVVAGGALWSAYYFSVVPRAKHLVRPRNAGKRFDTTVPEDVSEALTVPVQDGVELDVWLLHPRREPGADSIHWVVVLHGIADQKRTMLGLARRFAKHGVGAVLLDLRGHGLSSEAPITFGAKETEDISAVLDAMETRGIPLGEVGTYGPSYGGAIALQLAAKDPRVTRAVSAGGFHSFRSMARPALISPDPTLAALVPGFFVDHMVTLAAREGGFRAQDASALTAVTESDARFILVHSRNDEVVPFRQAQDFVATCGERCELITLEDTTHHGSLSNRPLRYRMHWFLTGMALEGL